MAERKGIPWYLVNGAMELSWILGWAMFCSTATLSRPFPFFEAIAAFALAAFITRLSEGRGWRRIHVLGLHLAGLIGMALLVTHGLYFRSYGILDSGWIAAFWQEPRGPLDGAILLLHGVLILVLWRGGFLLARRTGGYEAACNRFDIGVAALFALSFVRMIAELKGGIAPEDPLRSLFVFPFFLFGLLAIGMARMRGQASRAYLPGYRGIGVVAAFAAVVLLGATGLILFFLPGLTATAEVGSQALAFAGRPLLSLFVALVRFMFAPRDIDSAAVGTDPSRMFGLDAVGPKPHDGPAGFLEQAITWGVWGLILVLLGAGVAVGLFFLLQWLAAKTPAAGQTPRLAWSIARFLATLRLRVSEICGRLRRMLGGRRSATAFYGALLGWARRSGAVRDPGETPLEFGTRLNTRFPDLTPQIACIICAFNREVYGEAVLSDAQLAEARFAWHFLRSPAHWPARLKSRLFPPGEPSAPG